MYRIRARAGHYRYNRRMTRLQAFWFRIVNRATYTIERVRPVVVRHADIGGK